MKKETEEKPIDQIETPKNKWLYPTDNFGKLEKNMIYESNAYQSGIKETEIEAFQIITLNNSSNKKRKSNSHSFFDFVKKLF